MGTLTWRPTCSFGEKVIGCIIVILPSPAAASLHSSRRRLQTAPSCSEAAVAASRPLSLALAVGG